jgi:hypothetical protein
MNKPYCRDSSLRRLAYSRGYRSCTFATRDEWTWPGYDRAYRAGARKAWREHNGQF